MNCLLCDSINTISFKVAKKPERNYYHCSSCDLIFMSPQERLDIVQEKLRYDHHQNGSANGYTSFLEPLTDGIHDHFLSINVNTSQISALDFGCGPTAYLSTLLNKKGYNVSNFDPFYFPDTDTLRKTYNLVTSTEVWEHFHNPAEELKKIIKLLKPGGVLGVMTSAHHGPAVFSDWYYRRDMTHVTFFSEKTMKWIADTFEFRLIKSKSPYWIFAKLR
ncbi:MAG: class I SAM-dependent methyltransferase [Bdellovibrio sp.]